MPARIVIRKGGIIASVEAEPEIHASAEPEKTLAVLQSL